MGQAQDITVSPAISVSVFRHRIREVVRLLSVVKLRKRLSGKRTPTTAHVWTIFDLGLAEAFDRFDRFDGFDRFDRFDRFDGFDRHNGKLRMNPVHFRSVFKILCFLDLLLLGLCKTLRTTLLFLGG